MPARVKEAGAGQVGKSRSFAPLTPPRTNARPGPQACSAQDDTSVVLEVHSLNGRLPNQLFFGDVDENADPCQREEEAGASQGGEKQILRSAYSPHKRGPVCGDPAYPTAHECATGPRRAALRMTLLWF